MSDDISTPRTDALIARQDAEYADEATPMMDYKQRKKLINHARQLERELAQAERTADGLRDAAKSAFIEGWLAGRASDPTPMTEAERLDEAASDWRGSDAERLASNAQNQGLAPQGETDGK